nr:hypothetical protein [Tanacetum cinerariifolium]
MIVGYDIPITVFQKKPPVAVGTTTRQDGDDECGGCGRLCGYGGSDGDMWFDGIACACRRVVVAPQRVVTQAAMVRRQQVVVTGVVEVTR